MIFIKEFFTRCISLTTSTQPTAILWTHLAERRKAIPGELIIFLYYFTVNFIAYMNRNSNQDSDFA